MARPQPKHALQVIGWREWVALPKLAIPKVKAKIDTGARSSALHAVALQTFERDGKEWVRFKVHPFQRNTEDTIVTEAEVLEHRRVRSSSGHQTTRTVVMTEVEILGERWPIELTLTNRDEMGFRMLLGREAVRGRWLVDAGRSYYNGRPLRKRKKKRKTLLDSGAVKKKIRKKKR